jgi:hypothetical protein
MKLKICDKDILKIARKGKECRVWNKIVMLLMKHNTITINYTEEKNDIFEKLEKDDIYVPHENEYTESNLSID